MPKATASAAAAATLPLFQLLAIIIVCTCAGVCHRSLRIRRQPPDGTIEPIPIRIPTGYLQKSVLAVGDAGGIDAAGGDAPMQVGQTLAGREGGGLAGGGAYGAITVATAASWMTA